MSDQIQAIQEIRVAIMTWADKNQERFAWRTTYNQFHALIAEVMLQRTRAEQAETVYKVFSSLYSSPYDALKEDPARLRKLLRPLGLQWRIEKIIQLIKALCNLGGNVPQEIEQLVRLPGVGIYAASAYLSLHAGVRMPIIDSNIVRLWGRVFGFTTDAETRRKKWFIDLANKITPQEHFREFNYAVLDLTRNVCKIKPLHILCPLTSICKYYLESQ